MLRATFALEAGTGSELVETESGVYVVHIIQRDPASVPPLAQVRDTIEEQVVSQLAHDAALEAVTQLRHELGTQLARGEAFEDACASLRVSPSRPEPFTRSEPIEGLGSMPPVTQAAFATPVGELSEPIDAHDSIVLIRVAELIEPDEAAWTADEQTELREQLLRTKQQARVAQWLGELRAQAQITSFLDVAPASS